MDAQPDWWRTFFSGLAAKLWLQAMPEETTRSEVDFLEKMLGISPPARLLDVPCGGGRHCLLLAQRGYAITGVDISTTFLDAARKGASERNLAVDWEERDMRDLPWEREFDGACCLGNSFGYYTEKGNADFLKAVARTLKPGAKFLIDTGYIVETLLPSLQVRAWGQLGDIYFLPDRRYDPATGRLQVDYTFIRGSEIEKKPTSAQLYTYRQFSQLMQDAGFTDLQRYGSLALEPFEFGAKRLLMVGTKT